MQEQEPRSDGSEEQHSNGQFAHAEQLVASNAPYAAPAGSDAAPRTETVPDQVLSRPLGNVSGKRPYIGPPDPPHIWYRRRGFIIVFVCMLLFGLVLAGAITNIISQMNTVEQVQTRTYPFPWTHHPHLIVYMDNGAVHIRAKPMGAITLQETDFTNGFGLNVRNTQVDYNPKGGTITIKAGLQHGLLFFGVRGSNLDVTVPSTTDVEVHVGSGTIRVDDVQGSVYAETGMGSLIARNVIGPLTMKIETGPINVLGSTGQINAFAQSGDITISQTTLAEKSVLHTENGFIFFRGTLDVHGSYILTSDQGPVNVILPETAAFSLQTGVGSGPLSNSFGRTEVGKGQRAALTINTRGGKIDIEKSKP